MAFAAQTASVPSTGWWLFLTALIWAVAYDTLYAMADRADDLKIGLKSTAIFLGRFDLLAVATLQITVIMLLVYTGIENERSWIFFSGLVTAGGFIVYQLWISRHRDPGACFRAFLNNNWLGMCIFIALATDYLINP
jgi:4-hydroxybenzoate polyprenyltransferase